MNFSARLLPDGLEVVLTQPLAQWATQADEDYLVLASQVTNDCEAAGIDRSSQSFKIPNEMVASWSESAASIAKLPPALPFPLDLRLTSRLGDPQTSITTRWLKVGTSIALSSSPQITGLLADFKGQVFRLTEPYWTVLALVSQFNAEAASNPQTQFENWAAIRRHLGDDLTEKLTDSFLRSLRVISANAFTLNFSQDPTGNPDIIPRLMRRHVNPTEDSGLLGSTSLSGDLALLPEDEDLFVARLDALEDGQTVFPLRDGTFVSISPALACELSAVRKIRRASPDQRRQAVLNPSGVLREIVGGSDADETDLNFIETDKYSERVSKLAKWVPPIVPWVKIPPIDWKGSANPQIGFRIGDKEVSLTQEEVASSIQTVQDAIKIGEDVVSIAQGTMVPATDATIRDLKRLESALAGNKPAAPREEKPEKPDELVLVIETNFEQEDFCRVRVPPRGGRRGLPYCLRTPSKPHQETGITWLQEHWAQGSKGCLLADDMGLGKTYQALAFLAWIKEQMNEGLYPQKPLLVVAPVGLLVNWEKEQSMHLNHEGLGEPLRAYGSWIKFLKRGSHVGGTAALDTVEMARAPWILANYEAISEYQLSFGAINFGAVVFDEAQKIKSPATAMTNAAKALNADFVVAMTGTPVENRLADLWCIADACQPGALKDLKSFSQKFETQPDRTQLTKLRDHLWQEESSVSSSEPLMMLRRLKAEKLKGLPSKFEHVIHVNMPERQLAAYRQATALNEIRGPQGTLGLIQSLRQISLHPGLFDSKGFEPADSARFLAALQALDDVQKKGEKALIFIESLEIQTTNHLPLLLQRRYGLKDLPMVINGAVNTAERQKRVDAFQSESKGFDVMLLSPKAGGVGITLTAANHVIHLSRWWNPAVEDQCSDRAYRIGQTKDVHIYYPMAINPDSAEQSFDLKLNELMQRKRDLSRSMLMPMEFGKEDYDALLKDIGVNQSSPRK